MAEAFRCDRCGCFFDVKVHESNRIDEGIMYRIVTDKEGYNVLSRCKWITLCPVCSDELHEFMKNAPKERQNGIYILNEVEPEQKDVDE